MRELKNVRPLFTRHILVWGWLRMLLAVAQLTLVPLALVALVVSGLHALFFALFGAATVATLASRAIFRGRKDPRLDGDAR
jgi:hypothetical protein